MLGLVSLAVSKAGNFLVVDRPERSDAIVVTQADYLDEPYWTGLRLLNDGFGRELLVDARADRTLFGRSQAAWAADFLEKTAGKMSGRVRVCPITADSTAQETFELEKCLGGRSVRSVLLVVYDYHSRRSLSTFTRLLPQYGWSIAAVPDASRFGASWWQKRDWAKTAFVEWQHLLWWQLVDRWRYAAGSDRGG
jgi:hypothetical protein